LLKCLRIESLDNMLENCNVTWSFDFFDLTSQKIDCVVTWVVSRSVLDNPSKDILVLQYELKNVSKYLHSSTSTELGFTASMS
jgi:hypothetical protein